MPIYNPIGGGGGGPTGPTGPAAPVDVIELNKTISDANVVPANVNAFGVSPLQVGSGYSLTIPSTSSLQISSASDYDRADLAAVTAATGAVPNGCTFTVPSQTIWSIFCAYPTILTNQLTPLTGVRQIFTASGTWVKPSWVTGFETVEVELWGAGGGGDNSTGGGGGAYNNRRFPISQLNATETVTIGLGGANGGNANSFVGGNSSFGTTPYLWAYGGGGTAYQVNGGGGGGIKSAGTNTAPGTGYSLSTAAIDWGGAINGGGAFWGGGGGSYSLNGGNSTFGGGGGAGPTYAAGLSLYGGNGGSSSAVAQAPGGGGGPTGSGARGECRVTIYRVV